MILINHLQSCAVKPLYISNITLALVILLAALCIWPNHSRADVEPLLPIYIYMLYHKKCTIVSTLVLSRTFNEVRKTDVMHQVKLHALHQTVIRCVQLHTLATVALKQCMPVYNGAHYVVVWFMYLHDFILLHVLSFSMYCKWILYL